MHRSTLLPSLSFRVLSHCREYCILRSSSSRLLCGTRLHRPSRLDPGGTAPPIQHAYPGPPSPFVNALAKCTDLSTQKYTLIYSLPHMKLLRAVSRLKLLQTAITLVLLPPVFYMYSLGEASYLLVSYSTGIAMFAGVMLYTASHFLRRVVGMMYLDSSQTTLKVSHLTFWGRRHDVYLAVSDVMTLGDTGDSVGETILRLKRYSSPETLYFSPRLGRVVDKQAFQKVFGTLI